jgi:CO/xanthine dehydrogenase Mo-binding subunit
MAQDLLHFLACGRAGCEEKEAMMVTALGKSVLRREGIDKLRGTTQYVDDLPREGVWVGGTVRSSIPHGYLVQIQYDPSFDWSQVVVVTAADIPGTNTLSPDAMDQPVLADRLIRHCGEPIALIAAPDRETLQCALDATRLATEPLSPVCDMDDALRGNVQIYGQDNIFKDIHITKGDVDLAMQAAAMIIEGEYTTGSQEHLYLEPQGMQAVWYGDQVTISGSMQCPYYVQAGLACLFDLPPEKIRVCQNVTGGGFGGKEDYPTMLAAHVALLARKAGRPVRMVYERGEDMRCTTKRHPARVPSSGW